MSQARGRYAGSRRNGQRQPHHEKKPPPQRPGPPYVKAPPRDSARTASIFKIRSFQFLVDAVGAENIAIALESNMTRVAELMKGERFTPETAFHMETTLGLPHGFFDQPNPALADETIARLKSPLDFVQIGEGFDAESEALEPAPARTVDQQPVPEDSLSEEAQMPKKVAGGSPRAVKNSRSEKPEQPKPHAPLKASHSKNKPSRKTPQQQPLALSDSAEVENIRRANLRLLTRRNGSKVRLGVVMEMSGFNIADRLHGKKRMDSVEANRFTERLGLPVGWLDSPRMEADIPESVSRMLAPAPRGRASVQQHESPAPATNDGVQGKLVDGKVRTRRERATALDASESPAPVSAGVAEGRETIVVSPRADLNDSPDDLASRSFDENDEAVPAVTSAPSGSMPESLSVSAHPQQSPAPLPFATVASLDNLHGIAPIAEALIKTLAGKARTGRLDELKALELLQQAVLL
ncbi:hypothetical protein GCT13_43295 [Paraburkholderia sp. CNPSo 3157]|uniref:Uncharacterized protein n=1 Tax=Paraburkholderia franconis TaxID=2654983 RepID=A0A7X1TL45_9BURK|nr:hypothetical protein [Paraburkholderia franconis]MPW23397.1 hypothetical protein [Paraburkholderia franconis]